MIVSESELARLARLLNPTKRKRPHSVSKGYRIAGAWWADLPPEERAEYREAYEELCRTSRLSVVRERQ